ncbi:MAG: hypothetical protein GX981_10985 [Tissierellia bacterium]|nr:hypothetical protein [Tissierellia bacterium]
MALNPFIPKEKANTVIIDGRISEEAKKNLKNLGLNIIPTIECKQVSKPISYHPDIVIHPINHNTLIIAPNVFDYYEEMLSGMGIRLLKGETNLGENYPMDIAYNVGRIGNYAVHNLKYMDEKLKFYLEKEGLELIHVEQGYTKCSMAIINEKSLITADYPIYEKLKSLGFNILLIRPGFIELKGYPYGFIGGTCGNLSKDEIIFSGKFIDHPNREKIIKFTKKYNKKIFWLTNTKIQDIGTIISLYCQ